MPRRAFSLVELLVVIAIIALLAAILFPAFATVRGRARQTSCLSNLKQIGSAVAMYTQDYDGRFPYAVDPSDRVHPSTWDEIPAFQSQIPALPWVQDALSAYTKSPQVFNCPADGGFSEMDFTGLPLDARPTSFDKFGSSYYYRTEVAALNLVDSSIARPAQTNLFFDGTGAWHGTFVPRAKRYNVLFADGHAKNINEPQLDEAWQTNLTN